MKTAQETKELIIEARKGLEKLEWELSNLNPEDKGFDEAFNKVLIREKYINWLERKFVERLNKENDETPLQNNSDKLNNDDIEYITFPVLVYKKQPCAVHTITTVSDEEVLSSFQVEVKPFKDQEDEAN